LKFKFYTRKDIPNERLDELREVGQKMLDLRIKNYKRQNAVKKVGRNESCPCGSGKKYKRCHGK